MYIADANNNRLRKVTISTGIITTIAGNGGTGAFTGDGIATSVSLHGPSGVILDSAGNVYFADCSNQRVRKISTDVITTIAGSGSTGYSGDGGAATSATFIDPFSVALDSSGT